VEELTGMGGQQAVDPRIWALEVSGLSKTFGATRVLTDLDLSIRPGEVHALVGQNGSGKSTLIKILSGYQPADKGGEVFVAGEAEGWSDKIAFVHQDLGFVDSLSIVENLAGAFHSRSLGTLNWRAERVRAERITELAGLTLSVETPMRSLQQVDKALLALARARDAVMDARGSLLVLDEPTAYLPNDRIKELLSQIVQTARSGIGVLLVTHHLQEVMAVADRVTVLRDGKVVATKEVLETTEAEIVEAMIGTTPDATYPDRPESLDTAALLKIRGLTADLLGPVDLAVAPGEIVGLAGLVASGWEQIPYAIMGALDNVSGSLAVGMAEPVDLARMTPQRAVAMGIALVPADRVRDSAVGELSVEENATIATLPKLVSHGKLDLVSRRRLTNALLQQFDVRPAVPDVAMSTLSGGNQQKVLMAKWLNISPRILVLHEPTQGVDVGARYQILRHVMEAAAQGAAVVIASAEHEDLANICHRVHVFERGVICRTLEGGDLTEAALMSAAQGI
jgi:ribose transport system ATP-binding protein